MINHVFYLILVFSFFLLIIKCEYIKNEKKEVVFETDLPQGGIHYEKRNSSLEDNYASNSDVKFGGGTAGTNVAMQLQVVVHRGEEQTEEGGEAGIALPVQGSVKSSVIVNESEPKVDVNVSVEEIVDSNTVKGSEPKQDRDVAVEEPASSHVIKETESNSDNVTMVVEPIDNDTSKGDELKVDSVVVEEEKKDTADSDVVTEGNTTKESESNIDNTVIVEEVVSNNVKENEPKTDSFMAMEEPTDSNTVKESEHIVDNTAFVEEASFTNDPKVNESDQESVVTVEESRADDVVKENEHSADSIVVVEEKASSNIAKESEPVADSTVAVEEEAASHEDKEILQKTDSDIVMEEAAISKAAEESESEPDDIAIVDESSVSITTKGDESNVSSPVKEDESNQDVVATAEEAAPAKTIPDDDFPPESNAPSGRKDFLVEFQERVNHYDEAIDEIILRSLNRENYNYLNMLEEYALKTKMSGEIYTGMRYIIKVIMGNMVVTPSYKEKKKSFKYAIEESTFKRHFVTSLFRWYKNFKLVESHFDKANYVYYIGEDDERVYSYRYTYRLILNLLSSETFSFYMDLNKFSLLDILDNYNKYNFKLNNSTRYYPFHLYSCKAFNDFVVDYFESYNHRYFEKHKHLIAEEVYKNGIKKNANKLFIKLSKLNPNFVLYPFRKEPATSSSNSFPLVQNYLDAEIDLIFSIFKEFLVNLLNDLYNEYYNDGVKHAMKKASHVEGPPGEDGLKEVQADKTERKEMTPPLDASSSESIGPPGVAAGKDSETVDAEDTPAKIDGKEPIADKTDGREPTVGQRDDPNDNEIWKDLLESYKDPPKEEDLKEYNQYILKNLNQILNHSAQKRRQEMEDYRNRYELKDGFIINVVTARHTPLVFNPSKDIYLYLNQISSKKQVNFKNIYDNLVTIIKYKEGSNFYDNLLQSRRVAGGLWRGVDPSTEELKRGAGRPAKRVVERVVVDEDLSSGMNSNDLNAFLLFIERGEEAHTGQGTTSEATTGGTSPTRQDVHSFYRNVDLSEFTPAAVNTKDQLHDQLKLLKKKYTEKLKNEATCVLAFLYLVGINDNGGKLQLPYGFPRNIDYSVKLIRKGKDGLCNFLSGILYHLNLPIFVNNSSISITTEMSEDLIDTNDNSLNSFFYIYYRNNGKIRNHDFLSNENRIIPSSVDNMKSKIVSYSLGSTKDDFYSKLAFTNNMIRLKYKNKDSNIYLRDYFDFTFDKKIYKNSFIKNNISPFLSSCDYLLSNILGAVVDSLKNTSAIESGVYEENISERNRHLIHNTVDYNKSLFEYFLKLADSRNSYALAALGEIYYLGNESIGIERDEVKAFEFWKKAADQGDSTSALSTGYAYLDEYKKHLRKEEIIKTMSKEDLLNMIREEKGSDATEAEKKDETGKEAGGRYFAFPSGGATAGVHTSSVGQPSSGQQNEGGSAPEGDPPVGSSNFMGASGGGADFSSTIYGGGSSGMPAESTPTASSSYTSGQAGIPFWGTEQNQNNADNTTNASSSQSDDIIKKYMEELTEERNKALKNAEQYFHKAIRNHEESVEHILAKYNIYKFGLGTEKNLELAGEYLKKAADKGDNISQMMLGHYYSGTDIGVKIKDYDEKNKNENLKKSYKYYSMSAKNGNIISLYNKNILILKGVNPNLKTFNEKCEKTLKKFHFIGLFNERLYVLTKLLRRNYDFKDYTGSLLVSVILSELGDHPNNVNASMLWDLKRKTMQTFTEKYNLVEGLLANLQKAIKEETPADIPIKGTRGNRVTNPMDRIIHRLYNKEKGGKYSLQMKSKLSGDSILKSCSMVTSNRLDKKSVLFKMKFCAYLREELLHRGRRTNKGERSSPTKKEGRSNRASRIHRNVYNYHVYQLSQTHKQIDLFEKYDQIVKSEMEKGGTPREKIQKAEKMKGTILEHFRTSEFLHCYYKPISYYQIKLEEEKKQSLKKNAQQEMSNLVGKGGSYLGYTPGKGKNQQGTDLFEAEFSRYSPLLEGEDMKEIFYYQNTYSSSMFEEIQSFSKNCDVCKQYYDIYSAYYGYKKSTIDLIRKYREGDEYTIKSKRKELQFLIRNSDEEDHEPLYYKALFLESNKLESLKNILQIYLKLATDNHNACNVIGVLGIFKILFKKVFFDVSFFFRKKKDELISGIAGINWGNVATTSESTDEPDERGKQDQHDKHDQANQHDQHDKHDKRSTAAPANSLQRYLFTDLNSCDLQNNFLFKSEFNNKCLNFDHFVSNNHTYSQISYSDFFKVFYTVVSSFFKVA